MPKPIGFIFSYKCEVREGDIEREGKGEGSSDKATTPWILMVSVLILRGWGNPKKHRVHKVYTCSESGEKVQVPLVGQGVLHQMMLILWITGPFRNFGWFMTSSKM